MIVPMKKVTLICLSQDTDRTLAHLRDIGLLHIMPIRPPASAELAERRGDLARIRKAVATLNAITPSTDAATTASAPDIVEIPKIVEEILKRKAALAAQRAEQEQERNIILPFGNFSPVAIHELSAQGIVVRLFQTPAIKRIQPSDGARLRILGTHAGSTAFALIGHGSVSCLGAIESPLPARSLEDVNTLITAIDGENQRMDTTLAQLAARRDELAAHAQTIAGETELLEVRAGMGERTNLHYLQGFLPTDAVSHITREARLRQWGILISEPDTADSVPTLIRLPRWVRPIRSLFDIIKITPGYREADTSGAFLLFLSLFFAIIVGDAGYGLVFLAITAIADFKLRHSAPREPFRLMYLFSTCAILWGALTGTYFGLGNNVLPIPGLAAVANWLAQTDNLMNVCLTIGATHLTLAHLWSAIRTINSWQALSQLGWIAIIWTTYFLAKHLLTGGTMPSVMWPAGVAGLALVILFMTPRVRFKTEWVNHAMLPLSLMSNFGDILSYLRLFALSVAGLQLASAFNRIATETIGFQSVTAGLLAALVLFLGHALNVALSAVSVLVHGIRLNAMEFSMHLGLEWTGIPYKPFARVQTGGTTATTGGT